LHVLCGLNGVIHSYDLAKASVHYINYTRCKDEISWLPIPIPDYRWWICKRYDDI